MNRPLIVNPEAERDVKEAKSWYDDRRAGLGDDSLLCVDEALDHLRRVGKGSGVQNSKFAYPSVHEIDAACPRILNFEHPTPACHGWQQRA